MSTSLSLLEQLCNDAKTPLSSIAIAQFKEGQLTFKHASGYRTHPPIPPHPNTTDTKYRIASVSKLVTTLGFMQLVEQNKINLDADVRTYLDFDLHHPDYPDVPITSRMLLNHTSSLRDGLVYTLPPEHHIKTFFDPSSPYFEEGNHFARHAFPHDASVSCKPGTYFEYCNLSFGILATIMERVSRMRFDHYMTTYLFEPLGLTCSYNPYTILATPGATLAPVYRLVDCENQTKAWHPQVDAYDKWVEPPDFSTYHIGDNGTLFGPQGGLRASLDDLICLMQLILHQGTFNGHSLLSPCSLNQIFSPSWTHTPSPPNGSSYRNLLKSYGLGSYIFKPTQYVGHLGDAYGLLSGFFVDRMSQSGLIYLIGGTSTDPESDIGPLTPFARCEESVLNVFLSELIPS